MLLAKLTEFLDSHGVKYVTINHSKAYTAQEVAASAHIQGKELAKTVMVKLDGKMAMAVLPASRKVDLDLLPGAPAPGRSNWPGAGIQGPVPGLRGGRHAALRQPLRHGGLRGRRGWPRTRRSPSTPAPTPS